MAVWRLNSQLLIGIGCVLASPVISPASPAESLREQLSRARGIIHDGHSVGAFATEGYRQFLQAMAALDESVLADALDDPELSGLDRRLIRICLDRRVNAEAYADVAAYFEHPAARETIIGREIRRVSEEHASNKHLLAWEERLYVPQQSKPRHFAIWEVVKLCTSVMTKQERPDLLQAYLIAFRLTCASNFYSQTPISRTYLLTAMAHSGAKPHDLIQTLAQAHALIPESPSARPELQATERRTVVAVAWAYVYRKGKNQQVEALQDTLPADSLEGRFLKAVLGFEE